MAKLKIKDNKCFVTDKALAYEEDVNVVKENVETLTTEVEKITAPRTMLYTGSSTGDIVIPSIKQYKWIYFGYKSSAGEWTINIDLSSEIINETNTQGVYKLLLNQNNPSTFHYARFDFSSDTNVHIESNDNMWFKIIGIN